MNTANETAKQTSVRAVRKIRWGATTIMLWLSARGPEKRDMEICSIGPTAMTERADFRLGSMMRVVASE